MPPLPCRRQHERTPVSSRALLRWETEGSVFHLSGQTVNVSEQGLALATYDVVPENASVSCMVPALELYGRAVVRHVRRVGLKSVVGLEFYGTPQLGG
jgi:hypothetical protein